MFCRSLDPDRSRTGDRTGPDRTGPDLSIWEDRSLGVLQAGHSLCSKQDISCASEKSSPVFQAKHLLCAKENISCVPSKTFAVFQRKQFLCSTEDISCVPITKKCTCHFSANSADRPEICGNYNQIRTNPWTIGRIRQKMACKICELRTAQKSRGWLRF